MTKQVDIEVIKADFTLYWCRKVQDLTELRKSKMSQSEMAFISGRSLKTIQQVARLKSSRVYFPFYFFTGSFFYFLHT